MSRFKRPAFDYADYQACTTDEQRNRLLFDWWCDDDDRPKLIAAMHGQPLLVPGRSPRQNDPAPPVTEPAPQGFRCIALIADARHVKLALTDTASFSNVPYAALGGASFLLGQDPGVGYGGVDWHAAQQSYIRHLLQGYDPDGLRKLAVMAVEQAELVALARPGFDLATFAEQAGLIFMGLLFGYSYRDHGLLEDAARTTYRALQYVAIGQHFTSEPLTLPAAQQALGRLVERTSALIEEYAQLSRSPRRFGHEPTRDWPRGVRPWSESGLSALGEPALRRAAGRPAAQREHEQGRDKLVPAELLSGRDRATVIATLISGTLGNIQTAVCQLVQALRAGPADERAAINADHRHLKDIEPDLERRLAKLPPIPLVPRRTLRDVELGGVKIPSDTDCLVLLEGAPACPHAHEAAPCPRIWGGVAHSSGAPAAPHECLGRGLSLALIAALVRHTLRLPGLKDARDPLTGEALAPQRLWGFACTQYPLVYERERRRPYQNLIVAMRVKPPIAENAARLRRLIVGAIPRIEQELHDFGSVRHAWFEFTENDSQLVLRTLYEGAFDAYIRHFAIRTGDLFDGLFEFLEDAPPRPVSEHPHEFVETIRRFNRAPLGGYLFAIDGPRETVW